MRKKIALITIVSMSLLYAILGAKFNIVVVASPNVIRVSSDYSTIQAAIDAANPGDTIQVAARTYYERVNVTKTISLIGEDSTTTILDGGGIGTVVTITAQNVKIEGFTIQNGSNEDPHSGLRVYSSGGHTISNNVVKDSYYGFDFVDATSSNIFGNTIANNSYAGVKLRGDNNIFYDNLIANNSIGVWVSASVSPNIFYRNNFVNNTNQAWIYALTRWDNGAEGNYWSDYEGSDLNGDGIGDIAYPDELGGWDKYPLMERWSLSRVFSVGAYYVTVKSNSTVASFNFNQTLRQITFRVTGPSGKSFFCNVTVPKALLNLAASEKWLIKLNETDISAKSSVTKNASASSVYFTHVFGSTYEVQIKVVQVSSWDFILPYLPYVVGGVTTMVVIVAVVAYATLKKKH